MTTLEEYLEEQARLEFEESYKIWAEETLEDNPEAVVNEGAYVDYLVSQEEKRAEDMIWSRGCGG